MSESKTGPRPLEETARDELLKERDDFLKAFFRKGVELTEELVRERDSARLRNLQLEEENARLRSQVASGEAIRELLKKIEQLESDREQIVQKFQAAQDASSRQHEMHSEIEGELANLANLYIASFQLHSSLDPRGVLQNIKELLAQFVGAEAFALFLNLPQHSGLVHVISEGLDESELQGIPTHQGPLHQVFSSGVAIVRDDDPRRGTTENPAAAIPVRLRDKIVGVLLLVRTLEQKPAFIQVDHELLKLLSAQAMTALIAASLYSTQPADTLPIASLSDLGI